MRCLFLLIAIVGLLGRRTPRACPGAEPGAAGRSRSSRCLRHGRRRDVGADAASHKFLTPKSGCCRDQARPKQGRNHRYPAEPGYLRSGLHIRFDGEMDKKGNLQADITEVELFTPQGKNGLGLFADKSPTAKPISKAPPGKYDIRGNRQPQGSRNHTGRRQQETFWQGGRRRRGEYLFRRPRLCPRRRHGETHRLVHDCRQVGRRQARSGFRRRIDHHDGQTAGRFEEAGSGPRRGRPRRPKPTVGPKRWRKKRARPRFKIPSASTRSRRSRRPPLAAGQRLRIGGVFRGPFLRAQYRGDPQP